MIKIKTPKGWKDIHGVRKTVRNTCVDLKFESGRTLKCTTDHKLKLLSGIFLESKYLSQGDKVLSDDGFDIVSNINFRIDFGHVFYDVLEVSDGHEYYSNGLVSHNCEFLGSSSTLVSGWKLKELAYQTPIHDKEGLTLYEQPKEKHTYAIVADVSRGKGLDYSAFQVIDVTEMPYRQVAKFRSNMITPSDYSDIIAHVGRHYNQAYVLVEINDIGGQVSEMLKLSNDYENVLYTQNKGRLGKTLSLWGDPYKSDCGVRTTPAVKREGCSILKLLVEQNQLILQDHDTISELSRFSKKRNSYEAEPGSNDDLVMCLVLFAWLSAQKGFTEMTDHDTMMKLRDKSEDQILSELMPFGIVDDGMSVTDDDGLNGWQEVDSSENGLSFDSWIRN